jgi:uncharacterized protein (DUF1330 family)
VYPDFHFFQPFSLRQYNTSEDITVHQPPSIILTGYEPGPAPYYSRLHLPLIYRISFSLSVGKHQNSKFPLSPNPLIADYPAFRKNYRKPPTVMTSNDQSSKVFYSSKYGSTKKLDGTKYMEWKSDVTEIPRVMNAPRIVRGEEAEPAASNTAAGRIAIVDFKNDNHLHRRQSDPPTYPIPRRYPSTYTTRMIL